MCIRAPHEPSAAGRSCQHALNRNKDEEEEEKKARTKVAGQILISWPLSFFI
jgi:hypothetical protein